MALVRVSRLAGEVLLVQLDGPDGFPRLTRGVLRDLRQQFAAMAAGMRPRAVVITGTEQAFAAGADLEEVGGLDATEALRFSILGQGLMNAVERCPVPVVAAIRGYCLGGGFDLAMACHLRIAATDATFAHPGGALGIITGWGGTQRLPCIIGRARALELLTTGCTIGATQALAFGLVSAVVPSSKALDAAIECALTLKR